MIILLDKKATDEEIKNASEDYRTYIKITADIEKGLVAIGGEYHYDAEQMLLKQGSKQEDIWGGGVDLVSRKIDTNAMINIRVKKNYSTEICDLDIRDKFVKFVKKIIPDAIET